MTTDLRSALEQITGMKTIEVARAIARKALKDDSTGGTGPAQSGQGGSALVPEPVPSGIPARAAASEGTPAPVSPEPLSECGFNEPHEAHIVAVVGPDGRLADLACPGLAAPPPATPSLHALLNEVEALMDENGTNAITLDDLRAVAVQLSQRRSQHCARCGHADADHVSDDGSCIAPDCWCARLTAASSEEGTE